jgi:hypothetical protein
MSTLISLLIIVLICAVVLWLASYALAHTPLDPTLRSIIIAVIALILLLWVLNRFGILGELGFILPALL